MDIYSIRILMFFLSLSVMGSLETWHPKRLWADLRWKRWAYHLTVSILNTILTRLVFFLPLLAWIHWIHDKGWGLSAWLGLTGLGELILTVIVFDLFDYWWHRLNHEVPFLWRFHRFHHYDTQVDTSTALRFQPGELFLSYLVKAVWIFLWGPSVAAFVLFEALVTTYSIFHHSNIDFSDAFEKMLRLVHMTPRLHASHHTLSTRTRNANYATIFLIWDRIFRTLKEPDFEEMESLGLPEGRRSYLTFAAYLKAPFQTME